MLITSLNFVIFCIILAVLYFLLPGKIQWVLLLIFSLYFYTRSGYAAVLFLLTTAAAAFLTALWMDRENVRAKAALSSCSDRKEKAAVREQSGKKKRHAFTLMCVLIFGLWILTKYNGMLLETIAPILPESVIQRADNMASQIIIPLGISFYTFNCAGYVIDVSRKKYSAERNPFRFLLFVSFFPHIIQGPFSRYDRLGRTLFEPHRFDWDRMALGLRRILYGYCQKLLVADKLAPAVNATLAAPEETPGIYLAVALLGYGIQLYADFAGYMNIMCGICQILGIELEENFRQPFFAVSVQDYWRRWHITLGNWYSDYVFYPISMGKRAQKIGRWAREKFGPRMGNLLPGYFAMVFVWTLTGLWHGASWTFVVWGWLNFVIIVFSMQAEPAYNRIRQNLHIQDTNHVWRVFQILRTIVIVSFLRLFHRVPTVAAAADYIRMMFTPNWGRLLSAPQSVLISAWAGKAVTLKYILAGIVCIFLVDLVKEKGKKISVPMPLRMVAWGLMFCLLLIGAGNGNGAAGGFMYAEY